ncbi:MAG TPA: hypothetical protein PLO29_03370, partial [Paludibacter sp.]|nr:hypothetical protein [Paludibacter sp.]
MKKTIFTFYLLICSMVVIYGQTTYVADGDVSEWVTTPIQSEPGVYPYFKFAEQNDVLYWAIYAAANKPFAASFADIFIDADYSTATGYIGATYSPWTSSGLDYLL